MGGKVDSQKFYSDYFIDFRKSIPIDEESFQQAIPRRHYIHSFYSVSYFLEDSVFLYWRVMFDFGHF